MSDDPRRAGVLDGVREAFAADEVGRRLDAGREPLVGRRATTTGTGARPASSRERRGRDRRRAARAAARAPARGARRSRPATSATAPSSVRDSRPRRRPELVLRVPQRQADGHQPLLRAVVQVALDPAALLVAGGDDPRAGCLDLGPAGAAAPRAAARSRRRGRRLDDAGAAGRGALAGARSCSDERRAADRRARSAIRVPVVRVVERRAAPRGRRSLGSRAAKKSSSRSGSSRISRSTVCYVLGRGAAGAQRLEERGHPAAGRRTGRG